VNISVFIYLLQHIAADCYGHQHVIV